MRTARVWTVAGLVAFLVVASGGERLGAATTYTVSEWEPDPTAFASYDLMDACGSNQVAIGYYDAMSRHALLWTGNGAACVDLHPSGFDGSQAWACDAGQQVGNTLSSFRPRAALWTGSAASYVDLHPPGTPATTSSGVYGCSGTQQVGNVGAHAVLWAGTAASCVDLHPAGFDSSNALGTSGTQQVGFGRLSSGAEHALLWSGTAGSAVDLHPTGLLNSRANAVCGSQQVGFGSSTSVGDFQWQALLWNGTAESCVDLHPAGFVTSWANETNGTQQVGVASGPATGGANHAAVWSGSAESYLDLHQFLLAGFTSSFALAMDAGGNITGGARDSSGNLHVVLWEPVPEPATLALLALGGLGVLMRRRRMGR